MSRSALATDDTLALRARDGDPAALTELIRRHRPMLVALCTRYAGHDGEDAVQQVLADLPRRLASYDPDRGAVRAWLRVVARHEALRTIRRRGGTSFDLDHADVARLPAPAADPAVRVVTAELLHVALAGVTPKGRYVLIAGCIHGRSDGELAESLGLDPITIRTIRSKARATARAAVSS